MHTVRRLTPSLLLLLAAPAAMAGNPPEYCEPSKSEPTEFFVIETASSCPRAFAPHQTLDALLMCDQATRYSIRCDAYPQEWNSSGNLMYEWRVWIDGVAYTYPPSFDPRSSFSCYPGEGIDVQVTVWNGTASDTASSNLLCGAPIR